MILVALILATSQALMRQRQVTQNSAWALVLSLGYNPCVGNLLTDGI